MSPFTEACHDAAVGRNAVVVMTALKGFNQDGVTVAMECEHDVAAARAGADGKPAHVISIYFNDRICEKKEFVRFRGGYITGDLGQFSGWIGWCGLALSGA